MEQVHVDLRPSWGLFGASWGPLVALWFDFATSVDTLVGLALKCFTEVATDVL